MGRYQTKLYLSHNAMVRERTCFACHRDKMHLKDLAAARISLGDAANNTNALFCALQAASLHQNYR